MSETVYVGSAIALLFLCSVICRCCFMVFGDYLPLPEGVRRALRYAPAAALTAIIVPDILPWAAGEAPALDYKLFAAIAATLVYFKTRQAVLVIVVGMATLWLLRWAFG